MASKTNDAPVSLAERLNLSNMHVRILSGVPWLAGVLLCIALGGWPWALLMLLAAIVASLEFYALAEGRPEHAIAPVGAVAAGLIILGVQIAQPALWAGAFVAAGILAALIAHRRDAANALPATQMTLIGLIYIALPLALTVMLRRDVGFFGVLLAVCVTVTTDTFAYFGGRAFGRRPLAPRISPKKTVEGFIIGLVGGGLFTAALLAANGHLHGIALLIPLLGPLLAVLGDLLESALKRHYAVKDSHLPHFNIIPGHGGVLDRADSLLLVVPFVALVLKLMGLL